MCQFEDAAFLNKIVFERMYEGQSGDFFVKDKSKKNLSPMECELTKRPTLILDTALRPVR